VLSDRERAVLALIGQGLSDAEIGTRLNVSHRTAQTHRSRILRKLNLKTNADLVRYVIEHELTT